MPNQSSILIVFFTIPTDTIAPLASCKQLRFVHQIAGSCGHLAPRTQHPTYTPKTVKYAKCPGDTLQICKVSPGHFAILQSVPGKLCASSNSVQSLPGTLCSFAKCPGDTLHLLQSVPGTLCSFAKCPGDTLHIFVLFVDSPPCVSGAGWRRVRGVLCGDWFVIQDGFDDDSVGLL